MWTIHIIKNSRIKNINWQLLATDIKQHGQTLGFQQVGITDIDLSCYTPRFLQWIEQNFHGEMHYMAKHGSKRYRPDELVPNTIRVISVRMNYLPSDIDCFTILENPQKGYISRYALGRDYHKVIRKRLQKLAEMIQQKVNGTEYRVFCDSAPVLEKPLAEKAGLGWIGKHTILLHRDAGSWFFLGEIFTDLPLPIDAPVKNHCGRCTACIDICPTQAIIAPYQLDARRCISYLTIELRGSIPIEFRTAIGNRIYGCDDCQLICPWNRFAKPTDEKAFHPRHQLDHSDLLTLFAWRETDFLHYTEGSPIRRIGYACWQRNIAVALGNAPASIEIIQALSEKQSHPNEMVREHVQWALEKQLSGM